MLRRCTSESESPSESEEEEVLCLVVRGEKRGRYCIGDNSRLLTRFNTLVLTRERRSRCQV